MYGDLAAVNKLEARFAEAFPRGMLSDSHRWTSADCPDSPLKRLAQRFTYNGVDQIGIRELGLGRQQPQMPLPPPQPTLPVQYGNPSMNVNMNGNGGLPPPPPTLPHTQNYGRPPSPRARSPPPNRRGRPSRSPSYSQGQGPPGNKRYRPSPSYEPAPPMRNSGRDDYDSRERDRPVNRYPSSGSGPPPPPPFIPPPRSSLPPRASPAPAPVSHGEPSGLAPAVTWFMSQLPSTRSFDGTLNFTNI
jgi:cleavage stimulation factor subunit 3